MNAEELGKILAKASVRAERNLWLGALLGREASTKIVIVGGSAIEVYTNGKCVSADIDLVGERRSIIRTLEEWGFRHEGRLWSRAELKLWVDPVGKQYTGDARRLREVSTPYGSVHLASVEDLIAKRLIEIKVWPRVGTELFDQAVALAAEYPEELDWDYLTGVAARDRAADLVPELRNRVARLPRTVRTAR